MLNKIKDIGKQTFVYGLGSILNKMLGFILIPFYQKFIPIGNFGNLVYYETIIVFLSAFLTFGISPAQQRFFYSEKEKGTYGIFLFNNFFGCFILALTSILPFIFFSDELSNLISNQQGQGIYLQITMWIVLSEVLYIFPLQNLQYEEKPISYFLLNALKLILSFGMTLLFIVHLQMGYKGIMLARLWGGVITLIIAIAVVIIPRSRFKVDLHMVSKAIRFGFPMVVSNMGYTLFMVTDRFMLNWLSTSDEVGKYGFGMKIANFISLIFVQTIGMSYFPSIMRNEYQQDNIRYYRKMLTYYCFIIGLIILAFLFFYQDILWIVGKNKEYWEGLKVVPILSLSFMVMGMNYFVGVGLFLKNQTRHYILPSFSAAGLNILLNLFLIPKYGMMGAGFSILAAQITYTSLLAILSGRQLKVGFEWKKIFSIYCLAIGFYYAVSHLVVSNFLWSSLMKLSALLLFPYLLYKLNFFEQIEVQRLSEVFLKWKRKLLRF